MAETLFSKLMASHSPTKPLAMRSELSIKENQTIYRMCLSRRHSCACFRIDDDVIREGYRCDFLILVRDNEEPSQEEWSAVFVELKGSDVEHALKQLDATLSHSSLRHPTTTERHARIVAKSFPAHKANPRFEAAKRDFKSRHKCSLKTVASGKPDLIV